MYAVQSCVSVRKGWLTVNQPFLEPDLIGNSLIVVYIEALLL